ncbi:putative tellurite resistance protein B-like protein [Albidovulum inexpectatum]|uniref:Putative tellurite resistance protein B-like protein n=1 Tax=Albidovulum inexpectatum TaxID=196587 RepID=A0A2S5JFL7_9RHOB|nr:TerB family tellurite resistance protein [Albidovulum inexpectatum]PPB80191.1 putative tellurite resistance protein B-like protein [Albidovulum inexpectatum]
MIGRLLNRLLSPAPAPLDPMDARLALAALLVRLARADDHYTPEERGRIDRILSARHAMASEDAARLRQEAEQLEAQAPDTVRFTRALKEAVAHENRIELIQAMWEVALSDDQRDGREDALIRVVADLLGVNDVERAIARQRVEDTRK